LIFFSILLTSEVNILEHSLQVAQLMHQRALDEAAKLKDEEEEASLIVQTIVMPVEEEIVEQTRTPMVCVAAHFEPGMDIRVDRRLQGLSTIVYIPFLVCFFLSIPLTNAFQVEMTRLSVK
jgi:hypothetical protein